MSLQFTSIEDAFSSLSARKKKERPVLEQVPVATMQEQHEDVQLTRPVAPVLYLPEAQKSLADEVFAMQPYINNLFMILVLGMLYDMRQSAIEIRTHMFNNRS
jgi:hypothetical protein